MHDPNPDLVLFRFEIPNRQDGHGGAPAANPDMAPPPFGFVPPVPRGPFADHGPAGAQSHAAAAAAAAAHAALTDLSARFEQDRQARKLREMEVENAHLRLWAGCQSHIAGPMALPRALFHGM